ncbi:MAG: uracil-DNA glycosylase [Pseudomonadota bacterium]
MTMPDEDYTTTPPVPAQTAREFLQDVRQLVAFQQAIGIEGYPRTPELERFLAGPTRAQIKAAVKPETIRTPSARHQTAAAALPDTTLTELYAEMQGCQRCPRHQSRNKIIAGEDATGVKLLIITDAPSAEDDRSGLPMSGEPGQLLDKMLGAIGLSRADVHLSLLTRCHAPEPPEKEAVDACLPFLLKEITLVSPKIICAMGVLTAQKLLHTGKPLSQLRGRFHEFQGIPLMATFSPEFLLKNPEMKKATWLDLQMIQKKIQAV